MRKQIIGGYSPTTSQKGKSARFREHFDWRSSIVRAGLETTGIAMLRQVALSDDALGHDRYRLTASVFLADKLMRDTA